MSYLERQTEGLLEELESGSITESEFWEYLKDLQDEVSEFYQAEYFASNEK